MRIRINRLLTSRGRGGLEGARPSSSPDYYFSAEVQHIAAIPFAFCRSWNFSLRYCLSAANQLTDYVYDETGLLREILSKYRGEEKVDRKIAREYDALDRLVKVTYDGRDVETFCYDTWGKVISSSRNGRKASYRYDYFGRLVEKNEDGVITRSSYNAWGQRTGRETVNGSLKLTETREYDALGRLSKIRNGSGGELTYHYDNLNRLVKQTVNGVPVEYSYDKYGRLVRKALMGFSGSPAVSELKYFYDPDGTIIAREVNGVRQAYKYDRRGQLLEVVGQERYAYDPAGNILSKTVNGVTTTYRYDRANQLVSSETEGKVTKYAYDAAGRLVKEGNKSYTYAWLDKLVSVSEAGKVSANFSYHFDGQIAGVTYADGRRENYLWDGLALIHRDGTELLNEPAVTGGNPVLSGDKVLFNDMLGNTLGVKGKDSYQPIKMTAFGESDNVDAFFTGKPLVGELGYAFLFRNYRPEQGKWQTADPLGYPDGWNNFAYVNNSVVTSIDWLGGAQRTVVKTERKWIEKNIYTGTHIGNRNEPCELFDIYNELVDVTTTYIYDVVPTNKWIDAINSGAIAVSVVSGAIGGSAGVIALKGALGGPVTTATITVPATVIAAIGGGISAAAALVAWFTDNPDTIEYLVSEEVQYSAPISSQWIKQVHSNCE